MAQTTSDLWKELWNTKKAQVEYAFDIDGTWYGSESEEQHSVESKLYQEFGIGNAASSTLTLQLFADDIPKGATIKRYARLTYGDQATDWLPKGTVFVNRRIEDDGYWTIEAFDALRKADVKYLAEGDTGEWPRSMQTVVEDIATRMGVAIDSRTVINQEYTLVYPNERTMRELLCEIAAAHGGNWIMTDAGMLYLVPLVSIPAESNYLVTETGDVIYVGDTALLVDDAIATSNGTAEEHYIGLDITSHENAGVFKPITRVTLMVDDDLYYTSPEEDSEDDTGMELIATCPSATQTIADNVLAAVKGYEYKAYSAGAANIDPAAELGDAVTADRVYSVIASISDDGTGFPDLSAPGEAELEEEFPFEGPLAQAVKQRVKLDTSYYGTKITRSEGLVIEKTDGETVSAKAVFNADELSFYDANNSQVLYFDPTTGTYKFKGELNVSDKFVVEENGDVTMSGNVTISGVLKLNGSAANLVQVMYCLKKNADFPGDLWTDEWNTTWNDGSTPVWARYSYDAGSTWTEPIQIQAADGARGAKGKDGADAELPEWIEAYTDSAEFDTLVTDEWVVSMNLYGSKIFGGAFYDDTGTCQLDLACDFDNDILPWLKYKDTENDVNLFEIISLNVNSSRVCLQLGELLCLTKTSGDKILPSSYWDISSPLIDALEDDDVIAKLQEVLGL